MKIPYKIYFKYRDGRNGFTCRMFVNRQQVAKSHGGGYDLTGTCIAEWLTNTYSKELAEFFKNNTQNDGKRNDRLGGYYGFVDMGGKHVWRTGRENQTFYLDGSCGFSEMQRIAREILGLSIEYIYEDKGLAVYAGITK